MPFYKKPKYVGRTEFNEAWIHMTRKIHLDKLAKPFEWRLQPFPNPELIRPFPTVTPKSVLHFKATKRLLLLSKHSQRLYTPKYSPPIPSEHIVEPATLTFVPSPRLEKLAHRFPQKRPKMKRRKSARKLKLQKLFLEKREEWLRLRAAPRKLPETVKPVPRKKRKAINKETFYQNLFTLALPRKRIPHPPCPDPFQVSKAALKYVASDNIKKISTPKSLPEDAVLDLTYNPFEIKKAALSYVLTDRMKTLATPHIRAKAVETDVREDAFSVLPRALKAICTKRTAILAKPIQRD